MPVVAAFIDELRAAFGTESIDAQILRGIAGEPLFYAYENGLEMGTPIVARALVLWHPITGCSMNVRDYDKSLLRIDDTI